MARAARVPLLLVGCYHMANPGADMYNLVADDVLAPARQSEIEAVVERLATFGPTKVAVEASFGNERHAERYRAYVRGEHELGRDETQQVGFRLAARLGHERVYPIDVMDVFSEPAVSRIAAASQEHAARLEEADRVWGSYLAEEQRTLDTSTVGSFLRWLNRPEAIRASLEPYLRYYVPVVEGDEYAGATMVANWYRRNLKIFANLCRVAEPEDRLFVLYGAGHVPLLRHFADGSGIFDLIDPIDYVG